MANLSFGETSIASRNAMLAAKVCKAIRQVTRGADLDERGQAILARGASLLSEVVQGSQLIERKQLDEQSHRADLKAYSHAISALELLQVATMDKDLTDVFRGYRDDLVALSARKPLSEDRLEKLTKFFSLLNEFFFRDAQQVPPPVRAEPVLSMLP